MKFDVNTNTLINEIMAGNTSAVMLFAPAGTGKADFLTELANRYYKVFWFNALVDDLDLFCHTLLEKVVDPADEQFKLKIYQLLYSKSEFNDENVVVMLILDYISKLSGNCLMVFERMENVCGKKLSLFERLIKYCPRNLKIVISSEKFINFAYTRLEPAYVKLIDETVLGTRTDLPTCDEYLSELTDDQLAFLTYLVDLDTIDVDFVKRFYPQCEPLLRMLSRKEYYVTTRDSKVFRMNTILRTYLSEHKDEYGEYVKAYSDKPLKEKYADYLYEVGKYFRALVINCECMRLTEADLCFKEIINDFVSILKVEDYTVIHKDAAYMEEEPDDKPYYSLFMTYINATRGEYDRAEATLKRLIPIFREQNSGMAELIATYRLARILKAEDRLDEDNIPLKGISKRFANDELLLSRFYNASVKFRKELDIPISEYETNILSAVSEKDFLYVKGMESLSFAYFDSGNYKKSKEIMRNIKTYLPYYVVPHSLIAFRYYDGEVELAEELAKEALDFAEKNEIEKDVGLLYSTLAMIDLYYGRVQDALKKYDIAVAKSKGNDAAEYFVIGQRCIAHAKYADPNYAKEVAHIYLKYCENNAPKYVSMMQLALCFCYLKLGDSDKVYEYATQCVQTSFARSTNWLIAITLATTYMLTKGELKDAATLVRNILRSSKNCGMKMIVVDNFKEVFAQIISYAKLNRIELDYVQEIEDAIASKKKKKHTSNIINIDLFGDIRISVGGEIIQWKTRKSKDLFLHYVLAGEQGIDRAVIIDYLWKDYLYESAINNLKTTNNIIRKTLSSYDIEYKLDYINSKYVLHIDNLESDYSNYKSLMRRFKIETSVPKMVDIMTQIQAIYKGDFATDVFYSDFVDERRGIKQDMIYGLLRLVRALAVQGEYMEAKRFLSNLIVIDKKGEYSNMDNELDSRIKLTEKNV